MQIGLGIRVIQGRGGLCLAQETLFLVAIAEQMGSKKLESHGPLELGVLGLIDDTHGACTEFFGDAVVRDGATDHRQPNSTVSRIPGDDT